MRDKKDMSEMTDSEISFRKFLKNLGVTTHKELENLINKKIENGELSKEIWKQHFNKKSIFRKLPTCYPWLS